MNTSALYINRRQRVIDTLNPRWVDPREATVDRYLCAFAGLDDGTTEFFVCQSFESLSDASEWFIDTAGDPFSLDPLANLMIDLRERRLSARWIDFDLQGEGWPSGCRVGDEAAELTIDKIRSFARSKLVDLYEDERDGFERAGYRCRDAVYRALGQPIPTDLPPYPAPIV